VRSRWDTWTTTSAASTRSSCRCSVSFCATALAIAASTKTSLWIAGVAIGVFVGPNQSASRSLMGRFVPPRLENEFFGFFAFSGKLTAFVGPFLLGVLTDLTGSQRVGVSAVLALFVVGLPLLLWVDEREGVETA